QAGLEVLRIPTPAQVQGLELSPDGRYALVGLGNGLVLHLDLETKQISKTLKGHTGSVGWVAYAVGGKHAFSASSDGTVRYWDLADGQEQACFRVPNNRARGGAVFPDGRRLLTGDSGGLLQVWDLVSKQEVKRIDLGRDRFINSLLLTSDGR